MESVPSLFRQRWQSVGRHFLNGISADQISEKLQALIVFSDFVRESLEVHPQWLNELQTTPPEQEEWPDYADWLQQEMCQVTNENQLKQVLRLFRQRIMVRIACAQVLELVSVSTSMKQLSVLAETIIVAARDWLYTDSCRTFGTPYDEKGVKQPLLVLGMGKLGGSELNFSSDIDLIFTWPANGQTQGGGRELENSQFFTRLGQRLIKVLNQPTESGIVFRVDMRLRPFGDSGPLAMTFSALEDYYQEQGRDWERYAMVKARVMGDDSDHFSQELYAMLKPFVYRRYIDFSVIQSLRNMKLMISREILRRGTAVNIKLGAGGIREIEFIVQVFQLIRGGREPDLQSRSLLPMLDVIQRLQLLGEQEIQQLRNAYLFLRQLENLLQIISDQQTHTLPDDELNCTRLAWAMGYAQWSDLHKQASWHMQEVNRIFCDLIGGDDQDNRQFQENSEWNDLWLCVLRHDKAPPAIINMDQKISSRVYKQLTDLRWDIEKRTIGQRGRQVLDLLVPRLLCEICDTQNPVQTLFRLRSLLNAIMTRTTYLELLTESPAALRHLARLCSASPMIADHLARYPMLLDEFIDPAALYQPIAPNAYRHELHQYLLRIPDEDDEQQLDALRQFKQAQLLRVAAADISGNLPTMQVSNQLTWLAEAIIGTVVQQAWWQMVARYGQPKHLSQSASQGFAVIGYGKLGGWELGYNSDLDLVFLHDCPEDVLTDGSRQIEGRQFYLRLVQRILHLFSTRTTSGLLYEVDNRLRPSGSAGMLITTISAFADYQKYEAWTWEHQALVRARVVYGDIPLKKRFDTLRRQVLRQPRDDKKLRGEVMEMRKKMCNHLASKNEEQFDIKTDAGGITDIEFITQYLVLRFAHSYPELIRWSDNVRILQLLAQYGILEEQQAQHLSCAYLALRNELHHLALQGLGSIVPQEKFTSERDMVKKTWAEWLAESRATSSGSRFIGAGHTQGKNG